MVATTVCVIHLHCDQTHIHCVVQCVCQLTPVEHWSAPYKTKDIIVLAQVGQTTH